MGDEIDEILLLSLKQAGVPVQGKDSMRDFEPEMLVLAVSTCLKAITANDSLPSELPEEMSGKFTVCTLLANTMMEQGYTAELGFQQFLYPDDKEVRKMLSWLVNKMPKSAEEAGADLQGANVALFTEIVKQLGAWKREPWFPPFSSSGLTTALSTTPVLCSPGEDNAAYAAAHMPAVTAQMRPGSSLAASLFEHNLLEVAKKQLTGGTDDVDMGGGGSGAQPEAVKSLVKSGFSKTYKAGETQSFEDLVASLAAGKDKSSNLGRATTFTQEEVEAVSTKADKAATGETPAEAQARKKKEAQEEMEREMQELEAKLAQLVSAQDAEQREADMLGAQVRQLDENIREAKAAMKLLEEEYLIKQRTLQLLDDVDGNKAKLQEICDKTASNLLKLANEWEQHRVPLINDYRKKKGAIAKRKEDAKVKLVKVKEMRDDCKALLRDLREKDERAKVLAAEYDKMPKDVKRSSYVNRILDIIKNVNKQKQEIDRILSDVREARVEINTSNGKLSRAFAAVDELVYKDAKAKPVYRAVYKILVEMHESFQQLDNRVVENGRTLNDVDMIQARISDMAAKNDSLDMKRILKDLKAIKEENEALEVDKPKKEKKEKKAK